MTKENAQSIIDETFKKLIKTYSPQPVVMERGNGVYAWDTDGKKYLDFAAGIAVASLGHAHPEMLKTINEQSARLIALQSSYATKEKLEAASLLVDNGCFDLVYFSNSGTESVEAALKCARKWAYDTKGKDCTEIIAFNKSFHGRTYGSSSVTYKRKTQPFFGPYVDPVHFADFNDLPSVEKFVSDKTAAIIVEPVQGEGGVSVATKEFLQGLRDICDKNKIVLIFDEVQTGMGRIGTFYAYQAFGVEPDIACLAKGMGGGFPVGAMVAKEEFGKAIVVGTHGTTYGGNPLACAVAATVMKELLKPGFLDNVKKMGDLFIKGLKDMQRRSNKITDIRGIGLLVGMDTTIEPKLFMRAMQSNGLMTTMAGDATARFSPPLIINEKQINEALELIEKTIHENG